LDQFERLLNEFVLTTLSFFDAKGRNPEAVFQAFVLGMAAAPGAGVMADSGSKPAELWAIGPAYWTIPWALGPRGEGFWRPGRRSLGLGSLGGLEEAIWLGDLVQGERKARGNTGPIWAPKGPIGEPGFPTSAGGPYCPRGKLGAAPGGFIAFH